MKSLFKLSVGVLACLAVSLSWNAAAQAAGDCEKAWTNYNEFKQRNLMEPSQYATTVQGAAVRAACGKNALPVPPGTDTPHRPIVRKLRKPIEPIDLAKPAKPN